MEFGILGPLRVSRGGEPVYLSNATKLRLTLAVLLAHAGRAVPTDAMVEALWPERPPASARRNVQHYVSQLRMTLGAEVTPHQAGGYTLNPGDGNASA